MGERANGSKRGSPELPAWEWPQILGFLASGARRNDRNIFIAYLVRLQYELFGELRKHLEDPDDTETTWEHPYLRVRAEIPCRWEASECPSGLSYTSRPQDRHLLTVFQVLTGGRAFIKTGDSYSPLIPDPYLDHFRRLPGEQKIAFIREWATPTFYGDAKGAAGIIGRSDGSKHSFIAQRIFGIYPLVLDTAKQTTECPIVVGLRWKGFRSPETWAEEERKALWRSLMKSFEVLRQYCRTGPVFSDSAMVQVRPGEKSVFETILRYPSAGSYLEQLSPKPLWSLPLGRLSDTDASESQERPEGPVLPITDGNGKLAAFAVAETVSRMMHPDNEKHHNEMLASIGTMTFALGFQAVPPATAAIACEAPTSNELDGRADISGFWGRVAGEILLTVLKCAAHHPEHLSVRKAIWLKHRMLSSEQARGGKRAKYGYSTIKTAWQRYKPVSHLWATQILLEDALGKDDTSTLFFFSLAENFRQQATRSFARGARSPVLDPQLTWRVPPDLPLYPVSFTPSPLRYKTRRKLTKYRAG